MLLNLYYRRVFFFGVVGAELSPRRASLRFSPSFHSHSAELNAASFCLQTYKPACFLELCFRLRQIYSSEGWCNVLGESQLCGRLQNWGLYLKCDNLQNIRKLCLCQLILPQQTLAIVMKCLFLGLCLSVLQKGGGGLELVWPRRAIITGSLFFQQARPQNLYDD